MQAVLSRPAHQRSQKLSYMLLFGFNNYQETLPSVQEKI